MNPSSFKFDFFFLCPELNSFPFFFLGGLGGGEDVFFTIVRQINFQEKDKRFYSFINVVDCTSLDLIPHSQRQNRSS